MFTNAIFNSQRVVGGEREPKMDTLTKLNSLALNILFGIVGLAGAAFLVAHPEVYVLTNSPILYIGILLSQACLISVAIQVGITNFVKSYYDAKDLYNIWKGHNIKRV